MKISEHLSLSEVIRSESAKRNGISNMPTPEHIENFKILAAKVFEPIREHFGVPIRISSGYRSAELNKCVNGSSTSQHSSGEAIDIDQDYTTITNKQVFEYIKDNLTFDQLINEFDYSWVHVSYKANGKQRGEVLEAYKVGKVTKYRLIK
jgi:zinc D-Ala-D-Ala carboxypeptidase